MGFGLWATPSDIAALKRVIDSHAMATNTLLAALSKKIDLLTRMEFKNMATFEEAAADLATLTDDMADRIDAYAALVAELQAAVAAGDTAKAEALAAQASQHTAVVEAISDRLRGVGADPENPVPDTDPIPEVPADDGSVDPTTDPEGTDDTTGGDAPVEDVPADDSADTGVDGSDTSDVSDDVDRDESGRFM